MQIENYEISRPIPISLSKTFEASIHEFAIHGIEGTSLQQISIVTGVAADHLSTTFQDTENLFSNVVKWYLTRYEHQILSGFAMHSNPVEAIRIALYECIELFCEDDCPHGSLLSVELMELSDTTGVISAEMEKLRKKVLARIFRKLNDTKSRFTPEFNAVELAEYYTGVMVIMIRQACDGVGRNELYDLADSSLMRLEDQPVIH
ncbi:TetR/AcrR family transcriptional regulator [Pseudovibrio sp. Tun.PSC04-5.I4]|uniref:TetR/AcrR family transcriptional regulator n=1 Tax=Pseudovibrio sp. Tun.PSC04-5.I4 TaxID=1798213 RepID=UPI0008814FD3|nr:TetR/AcrR family transcriptional regulator [Pseudovibrio sp. Tun.PSC04-5.I4]SDQ95640.1 hypothetical protein SAMN04515695_2050 [Pseudovibrio sp. Tun.PSC04-5.I4]